MWQQVEQALRQSAQQVLYKLASFLPALIALLLALVVMTAIGMGLAALLRRSLTAAKFDERLARNSSATISDWSPAHSPTALLARVVFWGCVAIGCFIGISAFDAAFPGESQISLFVLPYLTHSIGAVLLLIAGTLIAPLQIGGAVVELAFGILFGGIVLTLALAVGLGSRDIVSRSLERSADLRSNLDPIPGDPDFKSTTTTEPLRHF